ncbi:MAG: tyrosine-type recombinase/integrase [Methanomicrobiales archaeon]
MAPRLSTEPEANTIESFYGLKSNCAKGCIEKGLADNLLTERDASLIKAFLLESKSSANIGLIRSLKIARTLTGWRRFIAPFDSLDVFGVYEGISNLKEGKSIKGTPFAKNTLYDHVRILKTFLIWMIDNEVAPKLAERKTELKIRAIRPPSKDMMTKVAGDLFSIEEVDRIIAACTRSRDRAMISMMYEGGFRIGEIGLVTWGDLVFDPKGVIVNTDHKTGRPRRIRLIDSKSLLTQWFLDYPMPVKPHYPVFLTGRKQAIKHEGIAKLIKIIAKRAGIEKRVHAHVFRHSRITHLIIAGLPESMIKKMIWGNITTNMFATYAHLTGEDLDRAIMKLYNLTDETEVKKMKMMAPKQCPSCATFNIHTNDFCAACLTPLNEDAMMSMDLLKDDVIGNPKALTAFIQQITARQIAMVVEAEWKKTPMLT